MDERVHARGRGDMRGKPDGQFRIRDDDNGKHLGVEDDLLFVAVFLDYDRGPADFGTGARRCRHGDDRGNPVRVGASPPIAHILEIPERARLARHEGNRLADIEARAAAHGDYTVMATAAIERCPVIDIGADGIALDLGIDRMREARLIKRRAHRGDDAAVGQSLVRHDQRPGDSCNRAGFAQIADAAGAAPDLRRIVPVACQNGSHINPLSLNGNDGISVASDAHSRAYRAWRRARYP